MAFAFAVFVIFAASVSASPLGQEKCSWGPSYWCESYKQAVECKALEHCRTKVWAVKNEAACEICELVVPKIKDYLSKNSTQTEVTTLLEEACNEIGEFAQMCKSLVDQYEPVIMSNLEEFLSNPQQVCTALGLCAAKQSNKVAAKLILSSLPLKQLHLAARPAVLKSKPYRASPQCILCEFVMDKLKTLLSEGGTQKEIEDALDRVCSLLPSALANECAQFVDQYTPAIIEILVQELDPSKVCTALGLCASEEHRKALEKPVTLVVGSNETCQICEIVMTYFKNLLADNATKQEILSLLESICDYLPPQIASECNAIVSEYGPAILDLIASSDPHTLCQEIGLCDAALLKKHEGDFCFLGASYWCANKRNAEKCGVVKYCSDHVWN